MGIKFNKIVKPPVPISEGNLKQQSVQTLVQQSAQVVQPAVKPATPPPAPISNQMTEEKFVENVSNSIMEGLNKVPQVQPEATEEQVQENEPVAETNYSKPAERTVGSSLEDTMRKFLGKQIRIYTSDQEYVVGRLEIVENGWVKICNARSAGSDYYFDEDIINTANIVRVRASVIVDKKQYVDFMNIEKK